MNNLIIRVAIGSEDDKILMEVFNRNVMVNSSFSFTGSYRNKQRKYEITDNELPKFREHLQKKIEVITSWINTIDKHE